MLPLRRRTRRCPLSLFLYREVLAVSLAWVDGLERAKRPARVPTVLSVADVSALLSGMTGTKWLMAALLYGAGLRLRECLTLRVKDVDFDYRQIVSGRARAPRIAARCSRRWR